MRSLECPIPSIGRTVKLAVRATTPFQHHATTPFQHHTHVQHSCARNPGKPSGGSGC